MIGRRALVCLLCMATTAVQAGAAFDPSLSSGELPEIEVIAETPIAAAGLPPRQVPGNIQTLSSAELQRRPARP